jgi:hypothetical protein
VLTASLLGIPATTVAEFKVKIRNLSNNVYTINCNTIDSGGANWYGTDTKTSRAPGYWTCTNYNDDCANNIYADYFERLDESHAIGGRCTSGYTPTIKGDGVLSAEIYIHSNISDSDRDGQPDDPGTGVYTIAAFGHDAANEWDLLVANISDGVVKFGSPWLSGNQPAFEVAITQLEQRWITVEMTRVDGQCSLHIERANGTDIDLPNSTANYITASGQSRAAAINNGSIKQSKKVPCRLDAEDNQIRINSRARDYDPSIGIASDNSFMSIRKVYWDAN